MSLYVIRQPRKIRIMETGREDKRFAYFFLIETSWMQDVNLSVCVRGGLTTKCDSLGTLKFPIKNVSALKNEKMENENHSRDFFFFFRV